MDPLLLPFLTATDELTKNHQLHQLLITDATPLIRKIMRRKVGLYVSTQGVNPNNQDAEDLYQEIMTKLLQTLRQLHQSPVKTDIQDFQQYVARIATNACIDLVRAKSPARWRLKHKLRFLLTRHPSFAVWKIDSELLCGFNVWRNTGVSDRATKQLADLDEAARTFAEHSAFNKKTNLRLAKLVADVFNWLGSPVELESLVSLIALLTNVKDLPAQPLDDDIHALAYTFLNSSDVEREQLLRKLWKGLSELSDKQKTAFCFRFEDYDGRDLFTLFLESKIVTLRELATSFAKTPEQLAELWSRLPMDPVTAAIELDTTRDQVHKWRFRARERLKQILFP